jgi:Type I restriction enzyme R protein N terminus (HSDR_N)
MKEVPSLFCQVRSKWVKSTPEELVRQRCLHFMINDLGYPRAQIVLEKELRQMPHLTLKRNLPRRRADILCFSKKFPAGSDLYPLLLVECKALKLTDKVINQVTSYNQFLGASFVAVVNPEEIRIGWYDDKAQEYVFVNEWIHYNDLVNVKSHKLN